jgi:uncharacterized protein YjiS (DUF1127 family)
MADSGPARRWDIGAGRAHGPTENGAIVRLRRELLRHLLAASQTIFTWIERSRQRRQLAALSDHSLKDLNISRADAEAEYRKRFWRP